jgi:hypothetical protein
MTCTDDAGYFDRPSSGENAMNRNLFVSAVAALALLASAVVAGAQQSGTAAEAKAMLESAVVALKAGDAAALAEFND